MFFFITCHFCFCCVVIKILCVLEVSFQEAMEIRFFVCEETDSLLFP